MVSFGISDNFLASLRELSLICIRSTCSFSRNKTLFLTKVSKADLDALLKDKAKLSAVLTYHVVAGKVMAADVKTGKVKTVQGSELNLSVNSSKKPYSESVTTVKVDNATVTKTDIAADNGVIHVIDTVVMPK